jgi:hypothetical protein
MDTHLVNQGGAQLWHLASDGILCNSTLWAACIGGAMQQDDYRSAIETAGPVHPHGAGQSKLPVHLRYRAWLKREIFAARAATIRSA